MGGSIGIAPLAIHVAPGIWRAKGARIVRIAWFSPDAIEVLQDSALHLTVELGGFVSCGKGSSLPKVDSGDALTRYPHEGMKAS